MRTSRTILCRRTIIHIHQMRDGSKRWVDKKWKGVSTTAESLDVFTSIESLSTGGPFPNLVFYTIMRASLICTGACHLSTTLPMRAGDHDACSKLAALQYRSEVDSHALDGVPFTKLCRPTCGEQGKYAGAAKCSVCRGQGTKCLRREPRPPTG